MLPDFTTPSSDQALLHPSADVGWRAVLKAILVGGERVAPVTDHHSIGSHFGRQLSATRELIAHQFGIAAIRTRVVSSKARPINIGHAIAQFVWLISGSDDSELIGFYHRFGKQFAEPNTRIPAAPGTRIFCSSFGDQFEHAVTRLSKDTTSRRAVIQFFSAEDATSDRRDVPCFSAIQFLVRRDHLLAIGTMRSQSVLNVLPYDLFLLTMLQEAAASRLELAVGPYIHIANSTHLYDQDLKIAAAVTRERPATKVLMAKMPKLDGTWRTPLIDAEQDIRRRIKEDIERPIEVSRYHLDKYWSGLLAVLIAAGRSENGANLLESDITQAPEELRELCWKMPVRTKSRTQQLA
jgi:thymidylate synthase